MIEEAGQLVVERDDNYIITGTSINGDKLKTTEEYNKFGELKKLEVKYGALSEILYSYEVTERDEAGRITGKKEKVKGDITDKIVKYTYDYAGRLKEVFELDSEAKETRMANYFYDENGNRLNDDPDNDNPDEIVYNYDNQDRLIQYTKDENQVSFEYNLNGEILKKTDEKGITNYSYDVFGNLKEVVLPDNEGFVKYTVDGLNRRIKRNHNGEIRKYLYRDGLNIVAEINAEGELINQFIYGTRANVPDYMVNKSGNTYRVISDHLGSVRAVIDVETGKIKQKIDYDEFGKVLDSSINLGFQPFGFAGGIYDHVTGLVRFGARDYDAEVGRWTAKDPILFDGGDTNLYSYVLGDPVNYFDPHGLYWLNDVANFSAGLGDALLLGFGDELRALTGLVDTIEPCSKAYKIGSWTSFAFGVARLGYAALAKGVSIFASSGVAASAFRETIKNAFRLGIKKGWRSPNKAKYTTDSALRAAAGRTNKYVNAYGLGVTIAGYNGAN